MTGPGRPLGPTDLKRLHRRWRRQTSGRLALVLDGVQNPFNLGSIARLAAAFGVGQAWSTATVALRDPKVQKTAMGSDRLLSWAHVETVDEAFAEAREAGYQLVGVELTDTAEPLFALELADDVALVVGHEERGISAAALRACDAVGYVPLVGRVGSLNVATATAAALYEVRRREWAAPRSPEGGPA
ncbi:MAG: TrmH family RNA methyltransferase [Acidimicrobiia bacterium]|nr:TrmH family RNA methyltransferase [Acidimicrobiia bacterium]